MMISFNIETLNFGANQSLKAFLIKFDIAITTFKNVQNIAVLKEYLNIREIWKQGWKREKLP